jgi:hypothetical protein
VRGWAWLSVFFIAACTLAPIDDSIKSCPCAPGYVCDEELTNTCYRPMNANQDCVPAITVSDFDADWATQNSIHWRWTPHGDPQELLRYEIHVVSTVERARRRVIGPDENSELGDFHRRSSATTDVLVDSITYEHEANTDYIGRIVAIDRNLCEFRSDVRGISTLSSPTGENVLLDDCTVGDGDPDSMEILGIGDDCRLQHIPLRDPECTPDFQRLGVCPQNLKWNNFRFDRPPLDPGRFQRAVFEVRVANRTNAAASWGRIWVAFGEHYFEIEPMTIENGPDFRSFQAPLHQLRDEMQAPLDLAFFEAHTLDQVNVGGWVGTCGVDEALGDCRTEGVVLVDEFRILY